jgi:hypothetical protein
MHYFGFTRFSVFVPGSAAWHMSKKTEKEYLNQLFSDERLGPRFEIFFERALPVYQEMSRKHSYRHIFSYSERIPDKWKEIIRQKAIEFPVLMLDEVAADPSPYVIIAREMKHRETSVVTLFRVDDDDILSSDFMDKLSCYAKPEFTGMAVSFGMGLTAIYENGKFREFREVVKPLLAIGTAYIGSYDAVSGQLDFPRGGSHVETDRFIPVILDSRTPTFLWTQHLEQDSYSQSNPTIALERLRKSLSTYKKIEDVENFGKIFPGVAHDLDEYISNIRPTVILDAPSSISSDKKLIAMLNIEGDYEFRLKVSGGINDARGALISFDFNDEYELISGLFKSSAEGLGFFRYLETGEGVIETIFNVCIPKGCSGVSLYHKAWHSGDGEASVIEASYIKALESRQFIQYQAI